MPDILNNSNSVKKKKIILISGDTKLGTCGVNDYSVNLFNSLIDQGYLIEHLKVASFAQWIGALKKSITSDLIHMQYPNMSWRTSGLPLLMILVLKLFRKKTILTLHEFTRAHDLRKILCILMLRMTNQCIVTNSYEEKAIFLAANKKNNIIIIPIGSNIKAPTQICKKKSGIIYFGLLAPGKGLERFIKITQFINKIKYSVTVIGGAVKGHEEWLKKIISANPEIKFRINLTEVEVSEQLNKAFIALLPFPDGISGRRGSALAALSHNLQVITTSGNSTIDIHREVCHIYESEEEARDQILGLLEGDIDPIPPGVIKKYTALHSWKNITDTHIFTYSKIRLG